MMFLAKNELQNAADAAALAGARSSTTRTAPIAPSPAGRRRGFRPGQLGINKSMKTTLATGTVTTGWWNITGTPSGMQAKTKSPIVTGDAAAIRVTSPEGAGEQRRLGGAAPRPHVRRPDSQAITASAVAVVSFPSAVGPNQTFPTAINNCMYDVFWDRTTNRPKIDPATGNPFIFRIGSSYHYGACESGQWTSLLLDVNDVPSVREPDRERQPDPLSIGTEIWIQPGTKTSLYNDVIVPSTALLPVVQDVSTSTHAQTPSWASGRSTSSRRSAAARSTSRATSTTLRGPGRHRRRAYFGSVVPPSLAQ